MIEIDNGHQDTTTDSYDPNSITDISRESSFLNKEKYSSEVSLTSQDSSNMVRNNNHHQIPLVNHKDVYVTDTSLKVPSNSQSDGSLASNTKIPNSNSENHGKPHHHHHHQCCSGFGTGNRRFHSDACILM